MKRFIATLNGGSFINIPADHMTFNTDTNMVMAFNGEAFVACVDIAAVMTAYISESENEE